MRSTFPNLENMEKYQHAEGYVERVMGEIKKRKMEAWLRMGVEFGLITKSEGSKFGGD